VGAGSGSVGHKARGGRESVDVQNTGCWMPDTMLVVIRVDTPY
jgi:hypothetical protein